MAGQTSVFPQGSTNCWKLWSASASRKYSGGWLIGETDNYVSPGWPGPVDWSQGFHLQVKKKLSAAQLLLRVYKQAVCVWMCARTVSTMTAWVLEWESAWVSECFCDRVSDLVDQSANFGGPRVANVVTYVLALVPIVCACVYGCQGLQKCACTCQMTHVLMRQLLPTLHNRPLVLICLLQKNVPPSIKLRI